jgi:DNA polymerase III delta prime subunit
MNEDKVVNVSIISLILKNFHIWIKNIKIIAKNVEIWKFVDSENTAKISEKDSSSNVSDYQIIVSSFSFSISSDDTRSVTTLRELSDKQRKKHKLNLLNHQYQKKYIDRINNDIMRMQNVIKLFARMYLFSNKLFAESRRMLQTLSARYKLSDAKVKEQLHETWRALKTSSAKVKIKQ